jgi:hypothetical protein
MRWMRKSMLPLEVRRGSGFPPDPRTSAQHSITGHLQWCEIGQAYFWARWCRCGIGGQKRGGGQLDLEGWRVGIDGQFVTEIVPKLPVVCVGSGGTLSSNAGSHGFLCKLKVTAERMLGVGVQSFQEACCG